MRHRISRVASAALCLVFAQPCCAQAAHASPSGWFGNVYLGGADTPFDARKVFVVSYRVGSGVADVLGVDVAYGTPSALPSASSDYFVELLGADGRTLARRPAADPRLAIVEKEGNMTLPEGLLSVRLGFDRSGVRLRLRDKSGKSLVEAGLSDAIGAFCRRNGIDPDCKTIRFPGQ